MVETQLEKVEFEKKSARLKFEKEPHEESRCVKKMFFPFFPVLRQRNASSETQETQKQRR